MDDAYLDEVFELTDADFAPAETAVERLAILTLNEAHEVLAVLLRASRGTGEQARSAQRLARELAARLPSST